MTKKNTKKSLLAQESNFLLYKTDDGKVNVDVVFYSETIWLTQKKMSELFDVEVNTINYHIKEIFKSNELDRSSTIRKIRIVQKEGTRDVERETEFYNLDMIISVGYRVNSARATQFRIWATKVLKEYIIKGFALDDERLKSGKQFGQDYFNELLARIRDIRSSERLFYQKITDIYAQCSVDYNADSETTKAFYATVQNKLHWAIHGHTASELISSRADASKPYMGLTIWKNAPKGKIRKSDVAIAKNYLDEKELRSLNRIVSMYLDYAETQAEQHKIMTMAEWIKKLDSFLKFNEKDVLTNPGKISAEVAKELAEKEFDKYQQQVSGEIVSDFDKLIEKTKKIPISNKKSTE
jgi:hypothetical protein